MHKRLTPSEVEQLKALADYIHENLHEHFTLKYLCKLAMMNRTRLSYGFMKLYGEAVFDWIYKQRMEKARYYIRTSIKPMKDIAGLVGFKYETNFFKAYKNYYGCTPGSERPPDYDRDFGK